MSKETLEALLFACVSALVIGLISFLMFWFQTVQVRADYAALKTICTANDIKEAQK